jgi:arylsulfatase A-like enzyme
VAESKPNIIFIIIDSARVDHFGLYGYAKKTTPFLEAARADLTVYLNANAPAAWTRPAMTSIFTSLYPQQYDFFGERYPQDSVPILPELLGRIGYHGSALSSNPFMSPSTGFDRGLDAFYLAYQARSPEHLDKRVVLANLPGLVRQYIDRRTSYKLVSDMINDQAKLLIRRARTDGRPFFIYIHHDAHHPYLSDRRILRAFLDEGVSESDVRLVEDMQRRGNMYWFNKLSHTPAERRRFYSILRSMHDASIKKNDALINGIMRTLKSLGIYDDTMIIVTGDHGEFLGERDQVSHGLYLYEESVRVPLIIKYPRGYGIAGTDDRLVSTIDLAPTLLDLAGSDMRSQVGETQGVSLLGDDRHEFVVSERKNFTKGLEFWKTEYPDHDFDRYDYGCLISFKMPARKFIWSSKGMHALFDLESDPGETTNLYVPDDPRSLTYLNRAREWMEKIPRVPSRGISEFDDKIKHHLRGLGYIE